MSAAAFANKWHDTFRELSSLVKAGADPYFEEKANEDFAQVKIHINAQELLLKFWTEAEENDLSTDDYQDQGETTSGEPTNPFVVAESIREFTAEFLKHWEDVQGLRNGLWHGHPGGAKYAKPTFQKIRECFKLVKEVEAAREKAMG